MNFTELLRKPSFSKKPIEKCQRVVKVKAVRIDAEVRAIETGSASSYSKKISRSTLRYGIASPLCFNIIVGD